MQAGDGTRRPGKPPLGIGIRQPSVVVSRGFASPLSACECGEAMAFRWGERYLESASRNRTIVEVMVEAHRRGCIQHSCAVLGLKPFIHASNRMGGAYKRDLDGHETVEHGQDVPGVPGSYSVKRSGFLSRTGAVDASVKGALECTEVHAW